MRDPIGLAIDEAHRSEHSTRHGAVVVKKGKVIQSGRNQYCSLERVRHFQGKKIWSIHAEMNVLAGLPKKLTKGADIYIVRILRDGTLSNSKPCSICMSMIQTAGIKRIIYSVNSNVLTSSLVGKDRIGDCHTHT